VNLLQQSLLDLWLGSRDDLCVVGDDYQSIYAFTGATPEHLLELPSASRTRRSCGSRRTTARRPRCSRSRTGSCRSSAGARRRCARRVLRARAGREAARSLADELDVVVGRVRRCTLKASRTRRWPCSTA
jgi:hypothetical protein